MDGETAALLREMKDRQDIYDCLMRYCRGIDRLDRTLLLSAYHPDAADDHGAFVGTAEGFADYAFALHIRHQQRTQHHITNHICEIDGDVAHAESYYIFRSLNTHPPLYTTASGRYLDCLERREGRWAIADRICLVDIRNEHWAPTGTEGDSDYMPNFRDHNDTSCRRPIKVDRGAFYLKAVASEFRKDRAGRTCWINGRRHSASLDWTGNIRFAAFLPGWAVICQRQVSACADVLAPTAERRALVETCLVDCRAADMRGEEALS